MCLHCDEYGLDYDPLHDDAQAMALVKKLRLSVEYQGVPSGFNWHVMSAMVSSSADLNRAIVECVAKMQLSAMKEPSYWQASKK